MDTKQLKELAGLTEAKVLTDKEIKSLKTLLESVKVACDKGLGHLEAKNAKELNKCLNIIVKSGDILERHLS